MKNKFKLFIITFICIIFFIWYYTNIDNIVLYSIPISKNNESIRITMGSSNWVEEWNRILNTALFSTTPIKIWDKYINKAGLNLYGITEHNSIFYYFINLTKIGFGSLCLTLLTIFCKKTIFNPFRNVYRYLKHRNLYVTSKMDETISFLNKLRDRVEKKMSKKYCILLKLLKKLHINQFI